MATVTDTNTLIQAVSFTNAIGNVSLSDNDYNKTDHQKSKVPILPSTYSPFTPVIKNKSVGNYDNIENSDVFVCNTPFPAPLPPNVVAKSFPLEKLISGKKNTDSSFLTPQPPPRISSSPSTTSSHSALSSINICTESTTESAEPDLLTNNSNCDNSIVSGDDFNTSQTSVASASDPISKSINDNSIPKQINSELTKKILCIQCGQWHFSNEAHVYDYSELVDPDLLCKICDQPLVDPLDTKCGHTFCSTCLKNRLAVNALCPLDQEIVNYLECQQSSNLVNNLLDKLFVICPNRDYCEEALLARIDLKDHLLKRCRGTVIPCVYSCGYLAPRMAHAAHIRECSALNLNQRVAMTSLASNDQTHESSTLSRAESVIEGQITEICLHRGNRCDLGISIVGGSDTPLNCIVVQELYLDGLIAQDGRLRPGDQILSINGFDLRDASHAQAKREFSKITPLSIMQIFREKVTVHNATSSSNFTPFGKNFVREEFFRVTLHKRDGMQLGIKIVGKKNKPGLYILELAPDSIAWLDGRLQRQDRILEINGTDLRESSQEEAKSVMRDDSNQVTLLVSRRSQPQMPDILRTGSGESLPTAVNSSSPLNPNFVGPHMNFISHSASSSPANHNSSNSPNTINVAPVPVSGHGPVLCNAMKSISSFSPSPALLKPISHSPVRVLEVPIIKQPMESLGMSIAGGLYSQRGHTPIYVTNLSVDGVLAQTRIIKKGDILLSINKIDLLGRTHDSAVEAIVRECTNRTQILLRLIEGHETSSGAGNFMPSWTYWLQLPPICHTPQLISLRRDQNSGSLGFSIIGGNDCFIRTESGITSHRSQPIVVKTVVPNSPAELGCLKCGDIIVSVNNFSMLNIAHLEAVNLLKQCGPEVNIQLVSWPGTIV